MKQLDLSLWQVDLVDRVTSGLWLPLQRVTVCDDVMHNLAQGETVDVAFVGIAPR